jgi:preprotein translocase subunit Sec63
MTPQTTIQKTYKQVPIIIQVLSIADQIEKKSNNNRIRIDVAHSQATTNMKNPKQYSPITFTTPLRGINVHHTTPAALPNPLISK